MIRGTFSKVLFALLFTHILVPLQSIVSAMELYVEGDYSNCRKLLEDMRTSYFNKNHKIFFEEELEKADKLSKDLEKKILNKIPPDDVALFIVETFLEMKYLPILTFIEFLFKKEPVEAISKAEEAREVMGIEQKTWDDIYKKIEKTVQIETKSQKKLVVNPEYWKLLYQTLEHAIKKITLKTNDKKDVDKFLIDLLDGVTMDCNEIFKTNNLVLEDFRIDLLDGVTMDCNEIFKTNNLVLEDFRFVGKYVMEMFKVNFQKKTINAENDIMAMVKGVLQVFQGVEGADFQRVLQESMLGPHEKCKDEDADFQRVLQESMLGPHEECKDANEDEDFEKAIRMSMQSQQNVTGEAEDEDEGHYREELHGLVLSSLPMDTTVDSLLIYAHIRHVRNHHPKIEAEDVLEKVLTLLGMKRQKR